MNKRSAIKKDFFMEIKKGMGRFLSILFIVALGTSFFSGIRSTESAMKITADAYYDQTHLMDIRVMSTLGLTQDDVKAFEKLDSIQRAVGSYSLDALHIVKDDKSILHIMAQIEEMNEYIVTEGEMPDQKGECLIDNAYAEVNGLKVGDTILLQSGTEDDLTDVLNNVVYTITGIGHTAQYMSFQRGSTNIGNGEVDGFMVIAPQEFIKNDTYTEIYMHVKDAKEEIAYSSTYVDKVEKAIDEIKGIQDERQLARKNEIIERTKAEFVEVREKDLQDDENDISAIEKPRWYIDNRDVLSEYASYGDNASRMQAIGRVFPVIFFIVAALISLTAMTRMVEEQRIQIGTLKAMGYSKSAIIMKYMGYAFFATLFGSILGILIGGKFFPYIIISAYSSMYEGLPRIIVPYHAYYAVLSLVVALVCTLGATLFASYRELSLRPAILMRPPAPKKGKQVFLERIPFIWKRLNFTWKSTIRNLVRYKKRFMMTVLGIGACTGLMLVGFGLRDSILDVARLQFNEIQFAEATLYVKDDISEQERKNLLEKIGKRGDITNFMEFYTRTSVLKQGKLEGDAYIIIPKELDSLSEFFSFHDRVRGTKYELQEDGVILTEKIAKDLGVQVGDSIKLTLSDYEEKSVKISAITENYLNHYIYISPELYEKLYSEKPDYNTIQLNIEDAEELSKIGESLMELEEIQSISYTETMLENMDDVLSSLDLVLIVLTISAGLLAFVVFYNLNTININERRRELATIKVLGFFDNEVSAYVYRENVLLTIIGVISGCIFGRIMHYFVITTVEIELMMFGRNINFPSYIYSMVLTVLFSIFVNAVMYFKIRKIDMIESLKSAE